MPPTLNNTIVDLLYHHTLGLKPLKLDGSQGFRHMPEFNDCVFFVFRLLRWTRNVESWRTPPPYLATVTLRLTPTTMPSSVYMTCVCVCLRIQPHQNNAPVMSVTPPSSTPELVFNREYNSTGDLRASAVSSMKWYDVVISTLYWSSFQIPSSMWSLP